MSGTWRKGRDYLFYETWSVISEKYWEITMWSCTDTFEKVLLTLPNFQKITLSRSRDIKPFVQGGRSLPPTPPPFMDEVSCEESQLMKWVGYVSGGQFSRWRSMGGNFSGRGESFPKTLNMYSFVFKYN